MDQELIELTTGDDGRWLTYVEQVEVYEEHYQQRSYGTI